MTLFPFLFAFSRRAGHARLRIQRRERVRGEVTFDGDDKDLLKKHDVGHPLKSNLHAVVGAGACRI